MRDEVTMALEKEKQRLDIKPGAGHHRAEASRGLQPLWSGGQNPFQWRGELQDGVPRGGDLNNGAAVEAHGGEQRGYIVAWSRTGQHPSFPDHWGRRPHKILASLGLFIHLATDIPLPFISQQSNQLCKASDFRAKQVPFLPGKGLFAGFYESYCIPL